MADGTRLLEPLGLKEHLRSGIPPPKTVANLDTPMIKEGNDSCRISNSDERRGNNYSSLDGKRTVVLSDLQALKCNSRETSRLMRIGQACRLETLEERLLDINHTCLVLAALHHKDNSLNKDSYCSGMHPSSSVLSSYKYLNTEVPSYASALDDTSYKRTHLMTDYHHLPFLNRSVDMWPSYSTSSSSNLDPVGDQKLLDQSLYDPIRDSIEQTSTAEKDLSANERKTADRAIAHQENMNTSSKEEKHSRSVNPRGQKRKQSKLEKLGPSCEIDTDFRRDGSVNYESGVMKHFRAALVELVKELLKPTWHEGLLMRDAYKMIVKKAVDKIINSLTPDQVLDTTESINQYLSVSKTKVAKLIEVSGEIW
ncbi:hypothetical protein RDI58_023999 [Solanum bulbocastanum]|uniref:SFR19-like C-terminal domain-containing protein n=1 Tax=Solanum bulbocastanum TaxID=147425 RepID=A0AAN8Y323_SOLBU